MMPNTSPEAVPEDEMRPAYFPAWQYETLAIESYSDGRPCRFFTWDNPGRPLRERGADDE